jgi:hypothetical protein
MEHIKFLNSIQGIEEYYENRNSNRKLPTQEATCSVFCCLNPITNFYYHSPTAVPGQSMEYTYENGCKT